MTHELAAIEGELLIQQCQLLLTYLHLLLS